MEGDPKFEARRTCPTSPTRGYAELLGLTGIRVDDPDEIGAGVGRGAARPTGRSCSKRSPTPRCRRCRRTSRSSRRRHFTAAVVHGDPTRPDDRARASSQKLARGPCRRGRERDAPRRAGAVAVERLDVTAYTVPTDAAGVGRHARVGLDDDRPRRGPRRRRDRARLHLRRRGRGDADRRRSSRRRRRRRRRDGRRRRRGRRWAARCRNLGRPGHRRRWRSPPSTPRSGISRRACSTLPLATLLGRARATRPDLRQRRLHAPTRDERLRRAARRLGRRRASRASR